MVLVPLTRATGLGKLPEYLEQRLGTTDLIRAFEKFDLPLEIAEKPNAFIPVLSMCDLFDHSARVLGNRFLGLEIGMGMSPESYGEWLIYSAQGRTLAEAFKRAERTSHYQMTGGRLYLDKRPHVSFWRYVAPNATARSRQHTDHLITPMIRFVRAIFGQAWDPEWVEVDYSTDAASGLMEETLGLRVVFEKPSLALAIKSDEIDRKRTTPLQPSGRNLLTAADVAASGDARHRREPIRSVYLTILLRLIDGLSDIDGIARSLDLSVQQLQRLLRQQGTSYRELLNQAKIARAKGLLQETNMNIIQIALALGYSDDTSLIRAFRKQTGQPPSHYR